MAQQVEGIDQEQTAGGNNAGFGEFASARYRGMGFTPARSSLTAIEFDRNKHASRGIKIYLDTADSDSIPDNSPEDALYSWTVPNADLTGNVQKFTLPVPQTLTIGAQYCFYIAPWNTTTDLYEDAYEDMVWTSSNAYAGGKPIVNTNGVWSVSDSGNLDAQFKTYGYEPVIYDVIPSAALVNAMPKVSLDTPKPSVASLQNSLTEQLYTVTINERQLMWTVPLLTYTNSYTVITSKAP